MNLVVGATGFLGSEICRQLIAKGQPVRGLVRRTSDPDAVARLQEMGVETVEGDLKDPASLAAACRGARAVLSTATITRTKQEGDSLERTDGAGQLALVDAARSASVDRFVYVSVTGNARPDNALIQAKRRVEAHLQQSGMAYTILRPGLFMEVWLSPILGFDFPHAKATIYGSGRPKISWVSLRDVAMAAVESLTSREARNAVIEFGGPEDLSPLEVIRTFERVAGVPFEVQFVPEKALLAQQAAATDSLQHAFTSLMLNYCRGDVIDRQANQVALPIRLTSVQDYARRVVGTGLPQA